MAEEIGYLKNDPNFATRAIHEGNEPEQWNSMAVVPPISMATTFKQDGPADFKVCGRCLQKFMFKRNVPYNPFCIFTGKKNHPFLVILEDL